MKNPIIKKEQCKGKIPVAFTDIKKPSDSDLWYQYLICYYREKHYKYVLSPKRKRNKGFWKNDYKYPWKEYLLPNITKTKEEAEQNKEKIINKAKQEIAKLNWKEVLKHPRYPMVLI